MRYIGMSMRSGVVHEVVDHRFGCAGSQRRHPSDEAVVEREWHHDHAPAAAEIKLLFGERAREVPCKNCFPQ